MRLSHPCHNGDNKAHVPAIALGLAGMLTFALAGCGGTAGQQAASDSSSPYLIGVTDDLSGPVSDYGQAVKKTWSAYIDEVNANGGVNGHKLKLTVLDDRSDATKVESNVRELISQGAIVIDGSTLSENCAAIKPYVTQRQTPTSCFAAVPKSVGKDQHYVYERIPVEAAEAAPMMKFLKTVTHSSNPSIALAPDTAAGAQLWGDQMKKVASNAGWRVAVDTNVDLSQGANLSSAAAKVAAAHPDAVAFELSGAANAKFVRAVRKLGVNAPLISVVQNETVLDSVKDPKYYQVWTNQYVSPHPESGAAKKFVRLAKSQGLTGAEVNKTNVGSVYDAIVQIVKALKKCGSSCSSSDLAKVMAHTVVNIKGVTPPGGFGYGRNTKASIRLPVSTIDIYKYNADSGRPSLVKKGLKLKAAGISQ